MILGRCRIAARFARARLVHRGEARSSTRRNHAKPKKPINTSARRDLESVSWPELNCLFPCDARPNSAARLPNGRARVVKLVQEQALDSVEERHGHGLSRQNRQSRVTLADQASISKGHSRSWSVGTGRSSAPGRKTEPLRLSGGPRQ